MKKSTFTAGARLSLLLILVALFQPGRAEAQTAAYFDAFYSCDAGYYPDLQDCRGTIGYPYDPTESQCRYNASFEWSTCVSGVYGMATPEAPDFCVEARQARDYCNAMYSMGGADPDLNAYMVCYDSSGISYCE